MISVGSVVRVYPGPPFSVRLMVYLILAFARQVFVMVGAVAQLGEHLLCKQGVVGSNPISSTSSCAVATTRTLTQASPQWAGPNVPRAARHGSRHDTGL